MTAPQREKHAYFPYIDGLRAIAVLSVLAYHLNGALLPGGFAGVDVFFVISGFVVSASVGRRKGGPLHQFYLYFLSRRFQRIAPALLVCLLVTCLAATLFIPDAWLSENSQQTARYAFFGFSNLILARNANSYFSPTAEYNPYTHTWSLGVEEQFYLLFPLLFWAWTLGGRWRRVSTGLIALAAVVSLAYAFRAQAVDPLAAFYLLPARLWELGAGVLLYQGMAYAGSRFDYQDTQHHDWRRTGLAFVGVALIAYSLVTATVPRFPIPDAFAAVAGTLLVLAALHQQPVASPLVRVLTWRPVRAIGAVSYSLYLWHWPVVVLFRWTIGLDQPLHQALAVAISLALAALSWRFVENPIRGSTRLRNLPRIAVVACGLLALYAGLHAFRAIDRKQPEWSLSTVARHADDWYPSKLPARSAPPPCGVGAPAVSAVGEGVRIEYVRAACDRPVTAPHVYAVGDSHAMAFGSLFADYVRDTGAPVTLYNNAGCAFLSFREGAESTPRCEASIAVVLADMVPRLKAGDVVFLPSLRMPRLVDQWARYPRDEVEKAWFSADATAFRQHDSAQARALLTRMTANGASVVIEAPNLLLNAPLYRCADPWTRTNPICRAGAAVDREQLERLREPVLATIKSAEVGIPTASVFDPFPILCPQGATCDGYMDGKPLFFDGDHVSAAGNRLLLAPFTEAVRKAVAPNGQGITSER
ncbi:acyltransferase family protein [Luteibacter aegosomatissinici]|uniref:acyltransferase family protein n=1 Tax=Luteibacter aegosomatissinici TaxID=2911539 RepID=UPI001FF9C975|nr:acyltransferase family protein [Luteibacter aegosomatissinici]UPG95329.1 acyltransferase [Luteibacter aegosomatissinici]